MSEPVSVRYRVDIADAATHIFAVTCLIADPDPEGQVFSLPGWIPGSYLVRDYARHVLSIKASAGGEAIALTKTGKARWRAAGCSGPLEIRYEVYGFDLSVRGAYLDTQRCFFNGVCLFVEVEGFSERQCRLELVPPVPVHGTPMAHWQVATAMEALQTDSRGFGEYTAASYDELIDHPVEISDFVRAEFTAGGVPHEMVISGRQHASLDRLCADVPKICETHMALFGDPPPMERYVFLVNAVGEGYGGLEHRASSALITRRGDLPDGEEEGVSKAYRRFLGLVSHEYFHLWNVKRIKPEAFTPFDLEREAYTTLLWVFEGITSYYDDLALVRSGLISREDYLELLGEQISRVWQTPGRHRQTLAESSFDAWIKLYKPDENSVNAVISYYSKGALAALALDLMIRRETNGVQSLDAIMRQLWVQYGESGRGLEEEGFEMLAQEVTGVDLREFFDLAVRSTRDLPLAELLASVGIGIEMQSVSEGGEGGNGKAGPRCAMGVRTQDSSGRLMLASVLHGGPAAEAGLSGGDELIALDGIRVTPASFPAVLASYHPDDRVSATFFRRDELLSAELVMQPAPRLKAKLALHQDAESQVLAMRDDWLAARNLPESA